MKLKNTLQAAAAAALLLYLTGPSPAAQTEHLNHARNSIVKIFVNFISPDFCTPWKLTSYRSKSGSGSIVERNLILTNAHVVSDATLIQVQKDNDPEKYTARALFVSHESDLALLQVEDMRFFSGTSPLALGGIPGLRSKVVTYGYPVGGASISITEGVVSRIEIGTYVHDGKSRLLMIQTDAAINPGNSGGPVIQDGKIVGVAFQVRVNSSNIGYMIPVPLSNHVFKDIRDGKCDCFPSFGIMADNLENRSHREFLGMKEGQSGVLVTNVLPGGSADTFLRAGDVILSIDGNTVASDGTILFHHGRIKLFHPVYMKQVGDKITVSVLRNGAVLELSITMKVREDRVPKYNVYDRPPEYIIKGGILFQPLSKKYMSCWNSWSEDEDLIIQYYYFYHDADFLEPVKKEFVILSRVLPDRSNTYISETHDKMVTDINGIAINELRDVIRAFEHPVNGYHVINVKGNSKPLVLKASETAEADSRIMKNYSIEKLIYLRPDRRP